MTHLPFDEEPDFNAPIEPVRPSRARPWMAAISILLIIAIVITGLAGFGLPLLWGQTEVTATFTIPAPSVRSTTVDGAAARLAVIDGDGRLLTMDEGGGSIVRHDLGDTRFSFPAWSPDGSRLAVTGAGSAGSGVYVVSVATGSGAGADPASSPTASDAPLAIYESQDRPAFYLYWTPNGRAVTFLTSEASGSIDLRVAPADGSTEATIVRQGAPMYWAWVDDARLLVHSGGGARSFLGEVGPDGEAATDGPAQVAEVGEFRAPAVSADGRFRAYAGRGSDQTAAVIVEPRDAATSTWGDTGRSEVKVLGPAAIGFDPAGGRLAFIARAAADAPRADLPVGPLKLIDGTSGEVRTLVAGSVIGFFWSPNGRSIAALRVGSSGAPGIAAAGALGGVREASVLLTAGGAEGGAAGPVAAGEAAALVAAPATAASPGLELQLVIVDPADGQVRSQRTVRVSDVFASQLLPYFDQYALSHRLWSSDGAAIALPVVAEDGSSEIRAFPADGSAARRIAPGVAAFWRP